MYLWYNTYEVIYAMAGYCVYCLTFPNNKKYVGMTYDCEKRWDNGKGYHGSPFYEEIKKFGWHNIKREILYSNLSVEEANEMEKLVIKDFETQNPEKGYNIARGGGYAGRHTEEAKEKISRSEYARKKTPEHCKHISEAKQGVKHHLAKPVYQYSKDGSFIRKWDYMNEAAKTLGLHRTCISSACLGRTKTCAGFIWTYEDRGEHL